MISNLSKAIARGCLLASGLAVGLLAVGCDREEKAYGVDRDGDRRPGTEVDRRPPADRTPTEDRDLPKVARGPVAAALQSIAQARCDREARCENIGADKRFASKQACTEKIKEDKIDGLNSEDCKGGIDQKELNECLTEIRNEDCNNPLDTIGRVAACRSSDMCKTTTAPNH